MHTGNSIPDFLMCQLKEQAYMLIVVERNEFNEYAIVLYSNGLQTLCQSDVIVRVDKFFGDVPRILISSMAAIARV